jgi:hypothetical protein
VQEDISNQTKNDDSELSEELCQCETTRVEVQSRHKSFLKIAPSKGIIRFGKKK